MSKPDTSVTTCGHIGVNWNGEGDCITCARDKVLTPNTKHLTLHDLVQKDLSSEAKEAVESALKSAHEEQEAMKKRANTKQELRERIEKIWQTHSDGQGVNAIEQLLSDTVNRVLDELEAKAENSYTEKRYIDGSTEIVKNVSLSAIEQVRKNYQ